MLRPLAGRPTRAVLALALALPLLTACGGGGRDDEPPPPTDPPPIALERLPSATPRATATATPRPAGEGASEVSPDGPSELPADPEAVIVQLARIEHTAWEPFILGQMAPHFSLQSSGFGVFESPYGTSLDGWYQTAMTREDARAFLRVLVDDIGVLDLAARRPEKPLAFTFEPDGAIAGCDAYGVIFVRTATREGRLVISECDLEEPAGPDAAALTKLNELVNVLERWKTIVDHASLAPVPTAEPGRGAAPTALAGAAPSDLPAAFRSLMGFYTPIREPYTPDSAVAYGTRARGGIPADAPRAAWPLDDPPPTVAFDADYGATPAEIVLRPPDSSAVLREALVFDRLRPPSFWGPLWAGGDGGDALYSIGIRPAVPGSNEVVVDYDYAVPRRGIGVGR